MELQILWTFLVTVSALCFAEAFIPAGQPFSPSKDHAVRELQVVESGKGTLIACWMHGKDLKWESSFSASRDGGKTWDIPRTHRHPNFEFGGNPTVAADGAGNLYALVMSANSDFGKGVLELSHSHDAGKTWSKWETIISKQDGFPDKPWLVAGKNGGIQLSYTEVSLKGPDKVGEGMNPLLEETIHLLRAEEGDKKWTRVFSTTPPPKPAEIPIWGHQGSSAHASVDGTWRSSWGDMIGGSLYLLETKKGKPYSEPRKIADSDVGTPITQLIADPAGKNIAVVWYEAHGPGPLYIVTSTDGGKTWSKRKTVSKQGTLASGAIDSKGQLHLMWTEMTDDRMNTLYTVSSDLETLPAAHSLSGGWYDKLKEDQYIGGYQSLFTGKDGKIRAYWIDWRKSAPTIQQGTWDIEAFTNEKQATPHSLSDKSQH